MSARSQALQKSPSDVVILAALRTPFTRSHKGAFKDTHPELLLSHVLRAVYTRVGINPALIEEIAVGNAVAPGAVANGARMAALHAGIPYTASVNTVNGLCASGLLAVVQIANAIRAGQIGIGIGAGMESMTMHNHLRRPASAYDPSILVHPQASDCLVPMGITSENVAAMFNVSRADQDAFAALSFQKAATARRAGKFKDEIVPVTAKIKVRVPVSKKSKTDAENWEQVEVTKEVHVAEDDGIREGVTPATLAKLKPAFIKVGSTHAGNASQVSDGAAAVLLARRDVAERLGLPILGKFVDAVSVGVEPRIMGVGPAYAIPKVLAKTGLRQDDIDFFEINEAFASQAVYCINHLGIPIEKVNLHGGAIAFGHPLGCTGSRQVATGLNIAKQYGHKVFLTSMCVGTGMGMAAVFVSEQ